jgi:hypothetical protein
MTEAETRLAKDRATREAALHNFKSNFEQVKTDLEARGISGRIADKAGEDVRAAFDEALMIASESKGIIAATLAALALWLLRNPLIDGLRSLSVDEPPLPEADPPPVQEPLVVSPRSTPRRAKEPTA